MNNPSPLIPEGSLLEQKTKSQSRVKVAFFCVVGIHVAVFSVVLLVQGCKKREQPLAVPETGEILLADTNMPPVDASYPPYGASTSAPPVMVEPPMVAPSVAEYTVERGDTFYSIAKKFGVSMKAVQDANPSVEPTKLKLGQKIMIPPAPPVSLAPAMAESGEQIHTVASGDTLSEIARRYGTTVKALRAANGLATDRIKVGDKLKIPAKTEAPAPAPAMPLPPTQ